MDAQRFDAVTRSLPAAGSRRRALVVLLGGVFASALGASSLKETAAKKKCPPCKKRKNGKCKKKKPDGTACPVPSGGACQRGVCVCPGGETSCGGVCRDLQTDNANCGICGTVCPTNQVCQTGSCFPGSTCPANTTSLCVPPTLTSCGASCNCARSAEGNVLCIGTRSFCFEPLCTTSADCLTGEACVDVSGCCTAVFPPGSKTCAPRCAAPTA
jgi:hypothetical protein